MIHYNLRTALLVAGLTLGTVVMGVSSLARAAESDILKGADSDADGTLDLREAIAAANAHFAALDPDSDGTIDKKEAKAAGITDAEFAKHDPDKDGTIDKAELSALVSERFAAAEIDGDKTLDAKELSSPKGQLLAALIK